MDYEFFEYKKKSQNINMVNVPVEYKRKEDAKKLGAKWNSDKQSWTVEESKYEDFMHKFTGKTKIEREIAEKEVPIKKMKKKLK